MANFPTNSPADTQDATDPKKVRIAAMNLLARREHALAELRQKLGRRFEDSDVVERELQRLADQNLQSDMRFVESFVRHRILRGYGPVRIMLDAKSKGVSREAIERAVDAAEVDWCCLAREVVQKKFGSNPPQEINEKARRIRFLRYRGFTSEHCKIDFIDQS